MLKLSTHEYQNNCPNQTKEQDQRSYETNMKFRWSCPRCQYKSSRCADYQSHSAQVHFQIEDPKYAKLGNSYCANSATPFRSKIYLNMHFEREHHETHLIEC